MVYASKVEEVESRNRLLGLFSEVGLECLNIRSLNLVDKFAHTSVNSAPLKRESSLSKFHFSDFGRLAGRQQTSRIQANTEIIFKVNCGYLRYISHQRSSKAQLKTASMQCATAVECYKDDEKFDHIKLRAGYISFGHNGDSLASVGVWATSETQNRRYPRPDQPSCGCSRWNDRWTTWAKEKKKEHQDLSLYTEMIRVRDTVVILSNVS
ncbi:hypothetical protein T11_13461 [Trichinella zimbabwensis]|uniref:Uncharacterized protein n=1 Tax=Trichinella zimbabwensis TaxID=268475 RepID=A0A0V1H8R9_9BILA|nr:hypothetical protein T11_13461 [Trichinella zimbabwensis]